MKYKYILWFCLMSLIFNCVYGQRKKSDSFSKELDNFRYSLHPYIDTMDIQKISWYEIPLNHPLSLYIQQFIQEHNQEIKNYQKNLLESFAKNTIDNSQFELDTSFLVDSYIDLWNPDLDEKLDFYKELKNHPIIYLFLMNPISHANMYIDMYLAHVESPLEVGFRKIRNSIAGSRIKTVKIDKNTWSIFISNYVDMYEFEYRIDTNEMTLLNRYVRK